MPEILIGQVLMTSLSFGSLCQKTLRYFSKRGSVCFIVRGAWGGRERERERQMEVTSPLSRWNWWRVYTQFGKSSPWENLQLAGQRPLPTEQCVPDPLDCLQGHRCCGTRRRPEELHRPNCANIQTAIQFPPTVFFFFGTRSTRAARVCRSTSGP